MIRVKSLGHKVSKVFPSFLKGYLGYSCPLLEVEYEKCSDLRQSVPDGIISVLDQEVPKGGLLVPGQTVPEGGALVPGHNIPEGIDRILGKTVLIKVFLSLAGSWRRCSGPWSECSQGK